MQASPQRQLGVFPWKQRVRDRRSRGSVRLARLRESRHREHTSDCSACVSRAAGDRGQESWVSKNKLGEKANLLRLVLSWAIWEGQRLQRGLEEPVLLEKGHSPCGVQVVQ